MIDFSKENILENEITILKPLQQEHIDLLLPFSLNEPDLWKYSLQSAAGKENMLKYIATALDNRKINHSYPFIITDKRNGLIAGSTRFYDYQPAHQTVQLGYTWYGQKFQGTGLNKNCKFLMLDFAFKEMDVERVEFRADANNAKSIAAMKSIGCIEEGILRSNCKALEGRRDSIILSILKNEWQNEKRSKLLKKCQAK